MDLFEKANNPELILNEVEDESSIRNFYLNRSVLITGASGFVGKVLIEKLLRTCSGVRYIFVVIRPKRNKQPRERLQELLKAPLFDKVREANLEKKVVVIEGDISKTDLGLSDQNLMSVMNEVSVVFHSAATIKFDEPLKLAVNINITGTKNVINLCRKMNHLAALVHVSTAYSNCDKDKIDEHVYPVDMDPEKIISLAEWMDEDIMQELKIKLIADRPNTYTFTKALAECLLVKCASDLPVVICRPSIVLASWKEPFSGWVDNMNGPTGIVLGIGKGIIRSVYGECSCIADLVPVDSLVNLLITLGWFANIHWAYNKQVKSSVSGVESFSVMSTESDVTALDSEHMLLDANNNNKASSLSIKLADDGYRSSTPSPTGKTSLSPVINRTSTHLPQKGLETEKQSTLEITLKRFQHDTLLKLKAKQISEDNAEVPVFHCTSGLQNPITWQRLHMLHISYSAAYPSATAYRYPCCTLTNNTYLDQFNKLTLHLIPGFIADALTKLAGGNPVLGKTFKKFDQATGVLTAFTSKQWTFALDNQKVLEKLMSDEDKLLFNFNLNQLDWPEFIKNYVIGARNHVLKEPMSNLAQARKNLKMVYYRNLSFQVLFFALLTYTLIPKSLFAGLYQ